MSLRFRITIATTRFWLKSLVWTEIRGQTLTEVRTETDFSSKIPDLKALGLNRPGQTLLRNDTPPLDSPSLESKAATFSEPRRRVQIVRMTD